MTKHKKWKNENMIKHKKVENILITKTKVIYYEKESLVEFWRRKSDSEFHDENAPSPANRKCYESFYFT